jgi:hypothetical protein
MNNMKIISLSAILAAGLALGACSGSLPSPSGGTTPPPTTTTGDKTTDAIIAGTVKACGFLPTVSTVTGIIASFIAGGAPVNSLVTGIAESICNAVAPPKKSMRRGAARVGPPAVGGVLVEGRFVR